MRPWRWGPQPQRICHAPFHAPRPPWPGVCVCVCVCVCVYARVCVHADAFACALVRVHMRERAGLCSRIEICAQPWLYEWGKDGWPDTSPRSTPPCPCPRSAGGTALAESMPIVSPAAARHPMLIQLESIKVGGPQATLGGGRAGCVPRELRGEL